MTPTELVEKVARAIHDAEVRLYTPPPGAGIAIMPNIYLWDEMEAVLGDDPDYAQICAEDGVPGWLDLCRQEKDFRRQQARSAILAVLEGIAEPSPAMIAAGGPPTGAFDGPHDPDACAEDTWIAMIQALIASMGDDEVSDVGVHPGAQLSAELASSLPLADALTIMRQWEPGLRLEGGGAAQRFAKGDYVLATKYDDGDPLDGYAIGFFDSYLAKGAGHRYMVVGSDGRQFRGNGFRRAERITVELGEWLVANRAAFEALSRVSPINLWRFKYRGGAERQALDLWAADEGRETVEAHRKRWFS